MNVQVRKLQSDEDWDFFFMLSFETLKGSRQFLMDELKKDNPDVTDPEELLKLHRKETTEYFDFSRPDAGTFIAETDDGIRCGYLWTGGRNSKDAWDIESPQWIYDIVVDPKFQGHGIGRKMMQKGEEFARELNLNLGLFVHADNLPAIALYEKMEYHIRQVPISKKLESTNTTGSSDSSFTIKEEQESDVISIQAAELERFTRKVRFSANADDSISKKLYEEHLEKFAKENEKHQRLIALTDEGVFAGSIWIGNSGFSEEVAMIHGLVTDSVYDSQLVGNQLIDSAEEWSKNAEFSAIYMLLHAEDDIDLEFFKERNYKVPGFFMEKKLKSR